jgi:aquaporin Z
MNTRALVAEFVGTFTLIFIGVGAIAANQITNGATAANHITNGALGLTGIALVHCIPSSACCHFFIIPRS